MKPLFQDIANADVKYAKIFLIALAVALLFYASFLSGAYYSCNKSGGTMLSNMDCIDYSSLKYCSYDDKIVKPGIPLFEYDKMPP